MSGIADLIERLEKLDGPSREVDAEIGTTLGLFVTRPNNGWPDKLDYGRAEADGSITWPGHGFEQLVPRCTASLDATIALVERVLPGWACGFDSGPKTNIAFVDPRDYADRFLGARYTAEAATTAIALCLALLRALQQEDRR